MKNNNNQLMNEMWLSDQWVWKLKNEMHHIQ